MIKKISYILAVSLVLLLSTKNAIASEYQEYGVYVEPTSEVTDYIQNFNSYVSKKGIFDKYNLKPFLDRDFPVHITLYLTSFDEKDISNIEKKLVHISNNQAPFSIQTTDIIADHSGYVMLNIKDNSDLQRLSNRTVSSLFKYRNHDYPMPSWVEYHPAKMESFKQYGSPNTFDEFNPHFTLMAFDFENDNQREEFLEDMTAAIIEYKQQTIDAKVDRVGFGKVEKHGQIVEKLTVEDFR